MTGFGRGEAVDSATSVGFRVEISSVNRKQLELKFNLPREIAFYEGKLRMLISERVSRGSLMIRVEITGLKNSEQSDSKFASFRVNEKLAAEIISKSAKLKSELGLGGDITISDLMMIPGVVEAEPFDFALPQMEELITKAAMEAVDGLVRMRETEGENLRKDISARIASLASSVDVIEPLAIKQPEIQREKLLQRLNELALSPDANDERVIREMVIYADRADVTEEITRLRSHFSHFLSFSNDGSAALGRNMDFLVQEIFREINTLGNKAASVDVSPEIVRMKTELEKVREQVQNVE